MLKRLIRQVRVGRPQERPTIAQTLASCAGLLLVAPVGANPPVPLLAQYEVPSGSPGGRSVSAIRGARAAAGDAYAAMVELQFGPSDANPVDAVWGVTPGATEGVLVYELVHEPFDPNPPLFEQVRFEEAFGFNAQGRVAYSALVPVGLCSPLRRGAGYLDSVWVDRTILAIDGSPVPGNSGMLQLFASRPGVTSDGRAFWHGGGSPVGSVHPQDVLPQWEALLIETAAGPTIPWVSSGLAVNGSVLRSIGPFAVSHAGSYAICIARLDDGTEALVRAGWDDEEGDPVAEPVRFGGTPVADGRLVTALGAEPGERWQRLLHVGAGEGAGMPPHWFVVAQLGTASASRHAIVMSNGSINFVRAWEGQSYDNGDGTGPRTLLGAPKHVAVNPQGDIAAVWRVSPGNKEALYLNERRLLETGDLVPMRDGQVGTLTSILGVNTLSLSGRNGAGVASVLFVANVQPPGWNPYARVQTLYRIDVAVDTGKICSADWNLDGQVNSSDISAFLTAWLADLNADPPTAVADFNNDGVTNSTDISAFLTAWLAGVGGGC